MSRYEWEEGRIDLPTAEFGRLRKLVEEADKADKERGFAQAQAFWGSLTRAQKSNEREYENAMYNYTARKRASGVWDDDDSRLSETARDILWRARRSNGNKPSRPTREAAQFPTNRTTGFLIGEASLTFNKEASSVTWHVPDNNHAVDAAHSHPVATAFFDALKTVAWTSRTGGTLTGNDEYNTDDREAGGGGNYYTHGFGPLGAAAAPQRTDVYQDAKGQHWRPVTVLGPYGFIGKVEPVQPRRSVFGSREWVATGKPKDPVPPPRHGITGRQLGQGRVSSGRPDGGQFTSQGRTAPSGW